jgi:GAF domain-containing protein
VPILFERRVLGVLHVGTLGPRQFHVSDAQLLQVVADRIGVGIAYAQLYEDERRARVRAQEEEARSRFLAELSAVLSSTLDYDTTLANVARLMVPSFADGCVLDIVRDGGRLERIAVAGGDPGDEQIARGLLERHPPDGERHPLVRVLRTGAPLLVRDVSDAMLDGMASDGEHRDVLRRFGIRSAIMAPLVVRGETLGVISFISRRPERRFGEGDLELALEIARRAAFAVENARLYRAARESRERVARQAARQRRLADAARVFAEASLDVGTVGEALLRQLSDALGDVCTVRLLSEDGKWLVPLAFHHPDPEAERALAPIAATRR